VFHFHRWKGLGECVSNHVVSRAVNKMDGAIFDNVSDKMKVDVNVFQSGMVLVVFYKFNGRFVI